MSSRSRLEMRLARAERIVKATHQPGVPYEEFQAARRRIGRRLAWQSIHAMIAEAPATVGRGQSVQYSVSMLEWCELELTGLMQQERYSSQAQTSTDEGILQSYCEAHRLNVEDERQHGMRMYFVLADLLNRHVEGYSIYADQLKALEREAAHGDSSAQVIMTKIKQIRELKELAARRKAAGDSSEPNADTESGKEGDLAVHDSQ